MRWVWVLALGLGSCDRSSSPPPRPPPPRPPPVKAEPEGAVNRVVQLSSRAHHTCGLRRQGSVVCWGKNTHGQLGDGLREDSRSEVLVRGVSGATHVSVGFDFSCALRKTGDVVCWGNNERGQLGDGRGVKPGALSTRPVRVSGLQRVVQLTTGDHHACALDRGGTVRCWGNSDNGQVGSDRMQFYGTPMPVERPRGVRQVAAGANHVCGLQRNGVVQCWGRNTEGQLGDGKSGSRVKGVTVAGIEDAIEIASGANHSCARRRAGQVLCWGDNKSTQLGQGAGRDRKRGTPVAVPGLTDVARIVGGGSHTCALLGSGRLTCWGANEAGQLGHRAAPTHRATPSAVRGVGDAIDVALGAAHTCALRKNGAIVCFGTTDYGALGPHRLL